MRRIAWALVLLPILALPQVRNYNPGSAGPIVIGPPRGLFGDGSAGLVNRSSSLSQGLIVAYPFNELSGTRYAAAGLCKSITLLTKTGGGAAWNAGASSVETVGRGDYVEMLIPTTFSPGNRIIGITTVDSDQTQENTGAGWYFQTAAAAAIPTVNGTLINGSATTWAAGDRFRISVAADGAVTHLKNGSLIYTSTITVAAAERRVVDTSQYTDGNPTPYVAINGSAGSVPSPTWTNLVNVSQSSACDLTAVNSPGAGGGAGSYAANMAQSSVQTLSSTSAALNAASTDFTAVVWGRPSGSALYLAAGSSDATGSNLDWDMWITGGSYRARVYDTSGATQSAVHGTAVSAGQRSMLGAAYSQSTKKVTSYVNDVAGVDSTALTNGVRNVSPYFGIGARTASESAASTWDGAIGPAFFYQGTSLSAALIAAHYNSGKGYTCANLPESLRTGLTACWDLNEASGTRAVSTTSACYADQVLTKTGGGNYEAGASSTQTLSRGQFLEFILPATTNGYIIAGLNNLDSIANYSEIEYSIYFEPSAAGSNFVVYESGTGKFGTGADGNVYAVGDRFRIDVASDGTVTYKKNGSTVYTSLTTFPAGAQYVVDVSLHTNTTYPVEMLIDGTTYPTWTNLTNVTSASACNLTAVNAPGRTAGLIENWMGMSAEMEVLASAKGLKSAGTFPMELQSFTVCGWTHSASVASYSFPLLSAITTWSSNVAVAMYGNTTSHNIWTGDAVGLPGTAVSAAVANQWYYLCGEYDSTTTKSKLYRMSTLGNVNSALSAAATLPRDPWLGSYLYVGANQGNTSTPGSTDSLSIWSRLLTDSERTAPFYAGVGVPWPWTQLSDLFTPQRQWADRSLESRQYAIWLKTGVYVPEVLFPSRKVVVR